MKFKFSENYANKLQILQNFEKGVIFGNLKNLGRYWHVGPQKALYFPAPYQNSGENRVCMLIDRSY